MRHCLPCHAAYADESVGICPDCGSRTVTEAEKELFAAEREALSQEEFVAVRTFDGPVDRAFLTEILSDHGVPWVVHAPATLSALFAPQAGFGVLLVASDAVEQARRLLRDYDRSVVPEDEPEA
jgi:predicted  nucleic acid-binding Zn-ribbon protein